MVREGGKGMNTEMMIKVDLREEVLKMGKTMHIGPRVVAELMLNILNTLKDSEVTEDYFRRIDVIEYYKLIHTRFGLDLVNRLQRVTWVSWMIILGSLNLIEVDRHRGLPLQITFSSEQKAILEEMAKDYTLLV